MATTGMVTARASADALEYLKQTLDRLAEAVNHSSNADMDYDGTTCLFGYLMDSSTDQTISRTFEAETRYVILGAGDNDVKDLDITVMDADGDKVVEDVAVDAEPIVSFTPRRTGTYRIRLRNHESDGPSFAAFVVLAESGHRSKFQVNAVSEAMSRVVEGARIQSDDATHYPVNQLIMFGGKVPEGQGSSFTNMSFPKGKYRFLARGNSVAEDIDATVVEQDEPDSPEGEAVAEDTDDDALPICDFTARRNAHYTLTIKNETSTKAAFVFGLLLGE